MPWKNEEEFVDFFVQTLEERYGPGYIVRDFQAGYSLPDVIWVQYSEDVVAKRTRHLCQEKQMAFTLACAYAMAFLAGRRWIRLSKANAALGYRNGDFVKVIDVLRRRGLVEVSGENIKAFPKGDTFALRNITVVEAKLRDWRRAIIQAQKHLWVTSNSYVLLPERRGAPAGRLISLCRRYAVGLKFLSRTEGIIPIIRLGRRPPYNTYLAWMLNERLLDEVRNGRRRV